MSRSTTSGASPRRYRRRREGGEGNALKHGFSSQRHYVRDREQVETLAALLLGVEQCSPLSWVAACEVAEAHLEVLQLDRAYHHICGGAVDDVTNGEFQQSESDRLAAGIGPTNLMGRERNHSSAIVAYRRHAAAARARRRRAFDALDRLLAA